MGKGKKGWGIKSKHPTITGKGGSVRKNQDGKIKKKEKSPRGNNSWGTKKRTAGKMTTVISLTKEWDKGGTK